MTLKHHHDYIVKRITEDGAGKHQVARELGVPYGTMTWYTTQHRIGIKPRPELPSEDWLRQHYGKVSINEMARLCGASPSGIHEKLVRTGIHRVRVKTRTRDMSQVLSSKWS